MIENNSYFVVIRGLLKRLNYVEIVRFLSFRTLGFSRVKKLLLSES